MGWLGVKAPATIRYAKENYVNEMPLSWWEGHIIGQIIRQTSPRMQSPVLDLGCGMGAATVLSARKHTTVGLDISVPALSRAQRVIAESGLAGHIGLVQASADALPFKDGAFGGAYAFDMLEHIYYSDQVKVLTELQRVLKPQAQLVGTTPLGRASYQSAHVTFFWPRLLEWDLERCGWCVRFCGLLPMPEGYGNGSIIGLVAQA